MKKALYAVVLVLLTMLGSAPAALAETPTDVVVEDQAGVLDQRTLVPALQEIEFYTPTKVAIFTYEGDFSENLNEEVLRFARDEHPEWLSEDKQKWADGLYIFALDPVGRHVGTYFGEDRKVSPDQRDDIQNATKDLLRDAQWTDGTIAGVARGAELINRPWYRAGWVTTSVIVGGIVTLLVGLGWILIRRENRKKAAEALKRGDASFAQVSMDLETTELNAKTIPESSRYGAQVLEKYRGFATRYREAYELSTVAHAISERDFSTDENVQKAVRYADAAVELDTLDDVIGDSNTLFNRHSGWERAWDRQVAPLRTDLEGIDSVINSSASRGTATAAALDSFQNETRTNLTEWVAGLESESLSPDDALDQLQEARQQLTTLLRNHSETVIDAYAKDYSEAELLRRDINESLQADASKVRPNILGVVYRAYSFYSVLAFSSGFSQGQSSVSEARSASESTTGYGGSGGSFSGSGSSSSF